MRRIIDFEICRVEINSGAPYDWPDVVAYETRIVGENEFHERLCDELRGVDYRLAFAKGDVCAASFSGRELVGYTFYSSLPTRARAGLAFSFPRQSYVYSYASATAPSHRGRRLEQDRWKVARRDRIEKTGADPGIIYYVNIGNLESRATGKGVQLTSPLIGYIGWACVAGRLFLFRSPGCRRAETHFVRSAS